MRFDAQPRPSVLVVEDERGLADLYVEWLREDYRAEAVYSGEQALEELHGGIDVVLLDRHMPDISGDEVLVTLRDWGLDCRVAMVTGVTPDFDVLTLGFDDYLKKPIDRQELLERVERLAEISSYDALYIQLSSLRVRRNTLRTEKRASELADDERLQALEARIADLENEIEAFRQSVGPDIDATAAAD